MLTFFLKIAYKALYMYQFFFLNIPLSMFKREARTIELEAVITFLRDTPSFT